MYYGECPLSRKCNHPDCKAEVPHGSKESGYCNAKYSNHWNQADFNWQRPKCVCGGDSLKSETNPHPGHSPSCDVFKWERE